jgi:hypothetical protein
MKKLICLPFALFLGAVPVLAQPAAPAARDQVRRNAQEQLPEGLIGTWKLDLAASHYESTEPKMQYRLFYYTHDGKLLVDYITLNANGAQAAGNWAVTPDGSEGIEYTKAYGSTPYAVVTLKMRDETTFDLTAARYGKVFETGTFKLAPDSNTLTFTYESGGKTNVAVYRRWNMLD